MQLGEASQGSRITDAGAIQVQGLQLGKASQNSHIIDLGACQVQCVQLGEASPAAAVGACLVIKRRGTGSINKI